MDGRGRTGTVSTQCLSASPAYHAFLGRANTTAVDSFFINIDRRLYGEVASLEPSSPELASSPLRDEALPYFARKQIKPEADGLMPDIAQECQAWREAFPHFRVRGVQVSATWHI